MATILDVVLGSRCAVCNVAGPVVCRGCRRELRPPRAHDAIPGLPGLIALYDYELGGRELVAALKYRGRTSLIGWLAPRMARAVLDGPAPAPAHVSWAPTTRDRRRSRGFDQSQLLARAVARALRIPLLPSLTRLGPGHQTGRRRVERREDGPQFLAGSVPAGPILVVDDVVTTGATLTEARHTLLGGGAEAVSTACVARVA